MNFFIFIIYYHYYHDGWFIGTLLLYSEVKNFTNNILRLFGVKHRTKLYSVNLS